MPAYSKEREAYHVARVRSILIRKSDAAVLEIRDVLSTHPSSPLTLNHKYLERIVKKIRGERAQRLNRTTVNYVLAELSDQIQELNGRLWLIIGNENAAARDKIQAIRTMRENSVALFDKMFDAGVFERQLGKVQTEKRYDLAKIIMAIPQPERDAFLDQAEIALSRS